MRKKVYSLEIEMRWQDPKSEITADEIKAFERLAARLGLKCSPLAFDTVDE